LFGRSYFERGGLGKICGTVKRFGAYLVADRREAFEGSAVRLEPVTDFENGKARSLSLEACLSDVSDEGGAFVAPP
jgi:hypothetical protein